MMRRIVCVVALGAASLALGVPEPVKMFGTEEQKREFLPRCARGAISAFLLTEPDVGSDPARLSMTAIPSEDGSEYVLDGVKLWTTNGVVAELLVVMARAPCSRRTTSGPASRRPFKSEFEQSPEQQCGCRQYCGGQSRH